MKTNFAELILENGIRFKGQAFGDIHDAVGEVVFSTGMVGYQEMLTDPVNAGQIVVMTYPLIGNYGINLEDNESEIAPIRALVVREKCDYPHNFRTEMTLEGFMKQEKILGIEGIDTRALTKIIRNEGTMRGIIVCGTEISDADAKARFESFDNSKAVAEVSTKEKYQIKGSGKNVAVIDLGTTKSVLEDFKKCGAAITVYPYNTSADEILADNPDVVFVSDGPGNPNDISETVETVKSLIGKVNVCGISAGHLVIALALGCKVEKMKFGHHGSNYPVKNIKDGRVYITTQSHSYVITEISDDVEISYTNVNDGSIAGISHKTLAVNSVQFRPDAVGLSMIDEFLK